MAERNTLSDEKTSILQLRKRVEKFVADRDWSKYHNPKNLSMSIAIEASELMELFQWVSEEELDRLMKDAHHFGKLQEELADVIIYCLSLANAADVDVTQAVVKKIDRNEHKYPVDQFKGNYRKYSKP